MIDQKAIEKNFGFLGTDFQIALMKELIENRKFSINIIDVLDSKYFDGPYFRYIVENIKELYKIYSIVPTYSTIEQKIKIDNSSDNSTYQVFLDTLDNIKNYDDKKQNKEFITDTALNFCKQQVLRKELKSVEKIIDEGKFEEYNRIEEIIQKALRIGIKNDNDTTPFENIDETLEAESRTPIPTGIDGLDEKFNGGLGIGEFGVFLAPLGIGKTTALTLFANSAFNAGFNTWQIYFEDTPRAIKQKHYARWTGLSPREQTLPENKEFVKEVVRSKNNEKNQLILTKYPSQTIKVSDIKNKLRKLRAEGIKIEMLIIDYIDCMISERNNYTDDWKGEASIMRGLEAMCDEFQMAIWVATQGNRCLSLDTIITLKDKGKTEIRYAQVGDLIETHLGYKQITNVFPIEKQPVYKITLKSGKTIKVSEKHMFPVLYKKFKSIETGLNVGDKLLIKKEMNF